MDFELSRIRTSPLSSFNSKAEEKYMESENCTSLHLSSNKDSSEASYNIPDSENKFKESIECTSSLHEK